MILHAQGYTTLQLLYIFPHNSVHCILPCDSSPSQITGTICDSTGRAHYVLKGHWDQGIHVAKVLGGEGKNMVTGEPDQLWQNVPPE